MMCVCHCIGARVPAVTIKLHVERKETYRPKGGMISMTVADKCVQSYSTNHSISVDTLKLLTLKHSLFIFHDIVLTPFCINWVFCVTGLVKQ